MNQEHPLSDRETGIVDTTTQDRILDDCASDDARHNNSFKSKGKDFKWVMKAAFKENQLHNVVRFITDYLR